MKHDLTGWLYKYGTYWLLMHLNPRQVLRPSLTRLIDRKRLIGVEIGVRAGGNARVMLETLDLEKLYLIDPYEPYGEKEVIWSREQQTKIFSKMRKRLTRYDYRIRFLRVSSDEAVDLIYGPVDFVYIDGNHTHPYVDNDIRNYYAVVEPGGVLGGHDFNSDYPDVMEAVLSFVHREDLRLFVKDADWWVIKR